MAFVLTDQAEFAVAARRAPPGLWLNAAAFWRHIGNAAISDKAGETWAFGAGVGERTQALETLEAPNFELPDFDGRMHRLSDYRGRKVFLSTWASW